MTNASIRHRENQQAVAGLIHDDRKIRELVDSHTKLSRARQANRFYGLQWAGRGVHQRSGLTGEIRSQNGASLRISARAVGLIPTLTLIAAPLSGLKEVITLPPLELA